MTSNLNAIVTRKELWAATKIYFVILYNFSNKSTVKPVYNDHPWDPQKVAVVQRWSVFGGFPIKIGIKICLPGFSLAVVDRWPLTQV